jgi:REP element-mobilizing transposase RayT
MARPARFEGEGALYHVINRGNYRADLFRTLGAKTAFLECLAEACEKSAWVLHAWCVMANHYHLALETPAGNLVEGMQWLQGTFATRFNRMRKESGHLFQGRYKSLVVDPGDGMGPLCHYIHLNPVRAGLCPVGKLGDWPWTSLRLLGEEPKARPGWYTPEAFLGHAGSLADTAAGRKRYLGYLARLAENEPARKEMRFEKMSKGWAIGTAGFKAELVKEQRVMTAALARGDVDVQEMREQGLQRCFGELLEASGRTVRDVANEAKSAAWKVELAAAMKAKTTVTNRWLGEHLNMGGLHEVSRRVAAWQRKTRPQGKPLLSVAATSSTEARA